MVPIPIGDWDVSEVTDMFTVFAGYTEFNEPIENWATSWGFLTKIVEDLSETIFVGVSSQKL
jgi:hypothetical protein